MSGEGFVYLPVSPWRLHSVSRRASSRRKVRAVMSFTGASIKAQNQNNVIG